MRLQQVLEPSLTGAQRTPLKPSGQESGNSKGKPTQPDDDADLVFRQTKKKFTFIAWATLLATGVGFLPFVWNHGLRAPSRILQIVGDFFGSLASISAPYALTKNEIENHKILKGKINGTNANGEKNKNGDIFDKIREAFYRCCSLGFTPFIFEPFINPDKLGKSIFHKAAAIINIPNLLFTGYAWGFGNFQALIAWGLREKESAAAKYLSGDSLKACEAREEGFDRIYNSAKRLATLGSIANPTMQGIRQAADSLALISGKMSLKEFFKRPLLGISRLVSLFVGIPEYFIKGVDSFVRVLDERKHLAPVLPEFWNKAIEATAKVIDPKLNTDKNNPLKWIRHRAEILFHTLSPLSMFALFTPMLDEPYKNEEAQSRGGLARILDRTIGTAGKVLTIFFTGSYVLFARLPQTIMQTAFYGKKFFDKRLHGKDPSKKELDHFLKTRVANFPIIKGISNWARKCVDYLVENYYTADHQHSHLTFEQVAAADAFAQAKEEFKEELKEAKKARHIPQKLKDKIIAYCIEFTKSDARKSYHTLSEDETKSIRAIISNKIDETVIPLTPEQAAKSNKPKVNPRFPGAYFLATYIFRLFNIRDRILNTDCGSDYRNMKTVYKREELDYSFEIEILPVLTECIQGLRRMVNLLFGIAPSPTQVH